ncbi:hypothetical protein QFZ81_004037 [Paenibacillus sp. V4I9]|uniref:hypothetical protein n=1 Tax=Paenibacillus sp. V4I9 TaxID=3042308 RepID=UPI002787B8D7|nr:hypothetical protein [Paenibacillus sp. V4I9]MDQ0888949.1 hypothetical protein [Paenibacillus sp. V4I9]
MKRGAKPIVSDSNIESIKNLIIEFDENHNMKSKLAIKDVSDYFQMLSNTKDLGFKSPSYSWWKTKGKTIIDEFNRVKINTIRVSESENVDTIDLIDAVEKHGGVNKEILKKLVSPTNLIIKRLESKIVALESKMENKNKELNESKSINIELNRRNEELQNLVFSLFAYGHQDDSGNITIGETKSKAVSLSLEKTFVDPMAFFNELYNRKYKFNNIDDNERKVLELKVANKKNLKTKQNEYDY